MGCGSGKITAILESRIRCKRIIAIDIDMKAIKYAQVHHASPRIEYVVADISEPWTDLELFVQSLEGKVSMIFSNRCLHWIDDKEQAIANCYRLLAPGGYFYGNTSTLLDLFYDMEPSERQQMTQIVRIPTVAEQVDEMRNLFTQSNFHIVEMENSTLQQVYPHENFLRIHLPYFPNLTKKFLVETNPLIRNKIMSDGLYEQVKDSFLRLYCRQVHNDGKEGGDDKLDLCRHGRLRSNSDGSDNELDYELTYGQIRIVATKL